MNGSRNPQRHGERSSLDALNRTIEGLEARIEGLMANGRESRGRGEERLQPRSEQTRYEPSRTLPLRDDPVSEIMQRQRAIEGGRERFAPRAERRPLSGDHYAAAQQAHAAFGRHVEAPARADGSVEDIAKALVSLRDGGWLTAGALLVVEEAKAAAFAAPEGFEELERRAYDDTEFVFLRVGLAERSVPTIPQLDR